MFTIFHWSGNIPFGSQFSNRKKPRDFRIFKISDSFMLTEINFDVVL